MRTRLALFTLLGIAPLLLSCSRTSPVPRMPPPPPSGGLLYAPFPDPDDAPSDKADDADDDDVKPRAPASPTAISADLPASIDVKLDAHTDCAAAQCVAVGWLPDAALAKVDGHDTPATLWQHDVGAGNTLNVPRHSGLDLIVVVLKGSVTLSGEGAGAPQKLAPWAVVRAPGAGVALRAEEASSLIVALVAVEGTLSSALELAQKTPAKAKWTKRPSAVEVKKLGDAADLAWGKGTMHARIAFGGEKSHESLEILFGAAGSAIPEHDHPTSWEHLAILQGGGTMQLAGKAVEVKAGSLLHIPSATRHAMQIGANGSLIAVQIYSPGGPEQRFASLAEADKK